MEPSPADTADEAQGDAYDGRERVDPVQEAEDEQVERRISLLAPIA